MNADKRYYLDTSALLPYYREESASRAVQEILLSLKPPIFISDLTRVEFTSAVSRWVRMDELTDEQAGLIEKTFIKDIDSGLYSQCSIMNSHYRQAERWLSGRHTSLRTLDALHLACCWSIMLK